MFIILHLRSPISAVSNIQVSDEGRETLLKEAALTALFNHDNVVKLVGVVTAPRTMPPMLILEYYENGRFRA